MAVYAQVNACNTVEVILWLLKSIMDLVFVIRRTIYKKVCPSLFVSVIFFFFPYSKYLGCVIGVSFIKKK